MISFGRYVLLAICAVGFSAAYAQQSLVEYLGVSNGYDPSGADIESFNDNSWEARCIADYDPNETGERYGDTYAMKDPYPCVFTVQFSKDGGRSNIDRDFSCTVPGREKECRLKIEARQHGIPKEYVPVAVKTRKFITPEQQQQNCKYLDRYAPLVTYPDAKVTYSWDTLSLLSYEIDDPKIQVSHRFSCDPY